MVQANLSPLKQTQANQANDNVNDNDTANENVSVNANAMTAQCAVGDPLDPCAADAARHAQLPFSVSKALWRSGGCVLRGFGEVGVQTGGDVVLEVSVE